MRWPLTWRTCPASNGSIMPWEAAMRRIQLSDLMLILSPLSGRFDDDIRKQDAAIARAPRQGRGRAPGHLEIQLRAARVRLGNHRGSAAIGILADARIQGQLTQQPHPGLRGHARTAAGAEDMLGVATVGA